jgi:membrane-associated phospholipid phosphatase
MTPRLRAAIIAVVAALLCGWIGTNVSEAPPAGIDLAGHAVAGHWTGLALMFTASCWWFVLVSLGIAGIVLAFVSLDWRQRVIFSITTTIVGWLASDALKNVFGRSRPNYWTIIHETSLSYPSGHAMFAVIVYGLWSYYVTTSRLPRGVRVVLSTALAIWVCGIIWSRLALGAHFITDLAGGMLFGITMLALAVAVVGRMPKLPARLAESRGSHGA